MMWEEWAIIFSPLGKKLFCFPTEPPAILSLSAMFEFLPRSHISIGLSHLENHNFYDFHDITIQFSSVQFSSVAQSCLTLCDPIDCSMPGFPVHHQLPELAQTHVHLVGDAIQPSHPLLAPSPHAFNLPQHQGLFQ